MGQHPCCRQSEQGDLLTVSLQERPSQRAGHVTHDMGGLVKAWAVYGGPSLVKRVPLRSAEWQEQPAHWLGIPLASHHHLLLAEKVKGSVPPGLDKGVGIPPCPPCWCGPLEFWSREREWAEGA